MAKNGRKKPKDNKPKGRFEQEVAGKERTAIPAVPEPVLMGLGYFVAVLAIIGALIITLVAIVAVWRPALLDDLHFLGEDYRSNIVIGAIFFWIEVAAIIIGARLLDQSTELGKRRKSITRLYNKLAGIDEAFFDLRYTFALDLDSKDAAKGYAGANFYTISNGIGELRTELMRFFVFKIDRFAAPEGMLFDRAVRLFDMALKGANERGREAIDISEKLQKATENAAADGTTQDTAALRENLEQTIALLMDEADAGKNGLTRFASSLNDILTKPLQKDNSFA